MSYIENHDLREWVKKNLRKSIFQKAHALAIQTGCDILVKLEDHNDTTGNQYYATHTLQKDFRYGAGIREKPGDMCVSGETGLPVSDFAIQSCTEHGAIYHPSLIANRDSFGFLPSTAVDSPSRHGSKHKSPGHSKRNGPFATDISPPSNSDGDTTPNKRAKTHLEDKASTSHGNDVLNTSVSKDGDKEKVSSPAGHITLSPVPVKQFQCKHCGKRLKTARSLQKHTKTFHSQEVEAGGFQERKEPPPAASSSNVEQQSPALTPISPERYPCQKCEQTFDCPDYLEAHMKEFHKKFSSKHSKSESLTSHNAASPSSSKKHTPKRDNHTPTRDDEGGGGGGGSGGKSSKRRSGTPKHGHHTPKQDKHSSKQEHGNHSSKHEHGHHSSKHEHRNTPKQEQSPYGLKQEQEHSSKHDYDQYSSNQEQSHRSERTPKHEHGQRVTPKRDHTPRHENHTPKHELTPKQDVTPKHDLTPKTPSRHTVSERTTPTLPLLGQSPPHQFGISPPALSSASSSPLSAPKTPGETIETQFSFEQDAHTALVDLPGSPPAYHSSGSEPSRPNTPGDSPSMSYEFSDEIQTSIMNIPSISSASEMIQESPSSPVEQHFTPPRSAKSYRMMSPDSAHKKQTSPRKSVARASEIKSAILSTPGPIVTALSLQNNGPQSVRHITRIQFESAIQGLQIADFGYVVPLTVKDNAVLVFVKKSPAEIQEVWNERALDLGLCPLERYHELYNLPAPREISDHVKDQLIEQGHVTEKQMNGMNASYHYTMSMEY